MVDAQPDRNEMAADNEDSLLHVQGLTYRYGNRVAVDDIEFSIRPGEVFGLLGPNGAGKTTTISCIAGLLSQYEGRMTFDGNHFQPHADQADRFRMGVVPQDLAIYEHLSAKQNLRLFAKLLGFKGTDVDVAVDRQLHVAGLADRCDDRVSKYSGGMKRRLNLAIGLLHAPPLIMLDEPTVGVDPQSRAHLFSSLRDLKSQGTAILYTTHYMEEADRLCDRIAIMCDGRIAAIGTRDALAKAADDPDADLEKIFLNLTGRSLRDA